MDYTYIKQIIEAIIFASDTPLTQNKILGIIEDIKADDVLKAIDQLNADYESTGRTFRISKIGGGYQLVTLAEFSRYIKKMYRGKAKPRLSQAALEALAIVAFKQPISRPDIDQIRGVNSDGVVKTLLERNLVTIAGRAEGAGRPLLYGTTAEFLRYFGVNEITDLPKPKEIDELLSSGQEELPLQIEVAEEEEVETVDDQAE
ncbi:SMC-Scp complex subunit ScpB [candidate division KSB1 bacterium]|nr:SMC-Scp complex subunit ScpB [candidate division KSB1 bacterium]